MGDIIIYLLRILSNSRFVHENTFYDTSMLGLPVFNIKTFAKLTSFIGIFALMSFSIAGLSDSSFEADSSADDSSVDTLAKPYQECACGGRGVPSLCRADHTYCPQAPTF